MPPLLIQVSGPSLSGTVRLQSCGFMPSASITVPSPAATTPTATAGSGRSSWVYSVWNSRPPYGRPLPMRRFTPSPALWASLVAYSSQSSRQYKIVTSMLAVGGRAVKSPCAHPEPKSWPRLPTAASPRRTPTAQTISVSTQTRGMSSRSRRGIPALTNMS